MTRTPKKRSLEANVCEFIDRFIGSIEALEILCLLSETPRRCWSVAEVFKVIRSSEASVAKRLREFSEAGFLKTQGCDVYEYEPNRPELAAGASALAAAYRDRRVSVVETIVRKQLNLG